MTMIETSRLDTPTLHRLLQRALDRAQVARERLGDRMPTATPISDEFAAIRALTPPGVQEDSVAVIRALRDE